MSNKKRLSKKVKKNRKLINMKKSLMMKDQSKKIFKRKKILIRLFKKMNINMRKNNFQVKGHISYYQKISRKVKNPS